MRGCAVANSCDREGGLERFESGPGCEGLVGRKILCHKETIISDGELKTSSCPPDVL